MGDSRNSRDLNSEVLAENWTLRFKIAEKEAEITSLNATAKVLFMCQFCQLLKQGVTPLIFGILQAVFLNL